MLVSRFLLIVGLAVALCTGVVACGDDDTPDTGAVVDAAETPAEETPTDETPTDDPAEETPTDETPTDETPTDDPAEETPTDGAEDRSGVDPAAFEAEVVTDFLSTEGPADSSLEPVRIGFMNQENDPSGSFPEYRQGAEGAVRYINEQRGGIGGRPVELVSCVYADPAAAQECAQQLAGEDLDVITLGVNIWTITFDFYGTIGDTPIIGGVPLFDPDYRATNARYFFGGSLSVFAGMGSFVANGLGATKVVTLENDNPAAESAAVLGLLPVLENAGIEVVRIKVPQPLTDAAPQVQQAIDADPDYILTLTAAAECTPIIRSASQLGWDMSKMVYNGTCNDTTVLDEVSDLAAGGILGKIGWNTADIESGTAPPSKVPEIELVRDIVLEWAPDGTPEGAFANVGAGSMLQLEALLEEVGADNLDQDGAILALTDDGRTRNGLGGFPWSCAYGDIGYPAVCGAVNNFTVLQADGTTLPTEGSAAGIWNGMDLLEPAS